MKTMIVVDNLTSQFALVEVTEAPIWEQGLGIVAPFNRRKFIVEIIFEKSNIW